MKYTPRIMHFKTLPVVFYTIVAITLACQVNLMGLLGDSGSDAPDPGGVTDDSFFWEAYWCSDCDDVNTGDEISVEQLAGQVVRWSADSRDSLVELLREHQGSKSLDPAYDRLILQERSPDSSRRFSRLTENDIRYMLAVLSEQG